MDKQQEHRRKACEPRSGSLRELGTDEMANVAGGGFERGKYKEWLRQARAAYRRGMAVPQGVSGASVE